MLVIALALVLIGGATFGCSRGESNSEPEAKPTKEEDIAEKREKQFICPTEEFVLERVRGIDEVTAAEAVTEDNDPNGNLNKAGGYTATIYFESRNVDKEEHWLGNDVIDNGMNGGGAVEVYANKEDAEKRDKYLSTFDGTPFSSGSHKQVGTCIIRTSDYLTATQQKTLEQKVIDALGRVD